MAPPIKFTKADIHRLFELLNEELAARDAVGEVYVVGGAVMCLVLDARAATRDVDAFFKPATIVRDAAARVAARADVPDAWLNDAVKGFLGAHGEFNDYLELAHLRVFVAQPEYLLAMKCAAMRFGEEFHDVDDIRYLLRFLNITTVADAMHLVTRYFSESELPPKTKLVLEELLSPRGATMRVFMATSRESGTPPERRANLHPRHRHGPHETPGGDTRRAGGPAGPVPPTRHRD